MCVSLPELFALRLSKACLIGIIDQKMKTLNAPGDLNLSRVLRLVWQVKGISRIEIAQRLGIDKSTVTKIASTLEDIGIIRAFAQGTAGPQGGRKPIQLEITPQFALALGIEINPDGIIVVLADLHGTIVESLREEHPCLSVQDSFNRALERIKPSIEAKGVPLIGIGLAIPAMVNASSGTILQSIPLCLDSPLEFSAWASETYQVPVFVDNDARSGCIGEIILKRGLEPDNALFLLAEIRRLTGSSDSPKNLSVGFGFIINGQPHYGNDFTAGEFRSVLWKEGSHGQFKSGALSLDKIGSSKSVTDSVLLELASHVALLANLLDLDTVFIAGLPDDLTRELSQRISEEISRKWPYSAPRRTEVIPASLGDLAVAYGGAGHCLQRFFSLPNIYQRSGSGPSVKESLEQIKS